MTSLIRATFAVNAMVFILAAFAFAGGATAAGSGCLPGVLKQRLAQVSQKFGPVRIVSSHRPGARIAGSGRPSYHASCRAVDFYVKGRQQAAIAWLKANHNGGVGTYSCGMHHIHIDNGPKVHFHKCVARNGAPVGGRRYAKRRGKPSIAAAGSKHRSARVVVKAKASWASTFYKI